MNKTAAALLVLLFSAGAAPADEAPPSDASIRELLAITDARNLVEGVRDQMNGVMDEAMRQALKGRTPSADEQAVLTVVFGPRRP